MLSHQFKKERRPSPKLPETESANLLRSIGVLPEVIIELANTPLGRVEEAIAHGQVRPEVRDLAGWVVKLLRTARDYDWVIPQSRAADAGAHQLIDVERYTSGAYGDLFRRGSDTSDLEPLDQCVEDLVAQAVSVSAPDISTYAEDTEDPGAPVQGKCSDGELTQQVREQLLFSCDRRHRGVIERLRLYVAGEVTTICAASLADARVVQDQLLGTIRLAIAELGAPTVIRITSQASQGGPAPRTQRGPGVPGPLVPGSATGSSP